ncbi:MAG TPA: hypothetical protein VK533_15055 [Sphingomonas sp.]|uniref:hypothetical protein n=1 Tax=Sphingomonas sp. TaxID=28214 RepID=UPI002CE88C01|nr:hypothetical protein [Sphingomonas sp.]HMI20852.1 hypothetical protein [Sphingomonas sp.]
MLGRMQDAPGDQAVKIAHILRREAAAVDQAREAPIGGVAQAKVKIAVRIKEDPPIVRSAEG